MKKNMENNFIKFTERELDIVKLVLSALNNNEIAEKLCVSKHTVKAHLENIYNKTLCHNRVELVVYLLRNGF